MVWETIKQSTWLGEYFLPRGRHMSISRHIGNSYTCSRLIVHVYTYWYIWYDWACPCFVSICRNTCILISELNYVFVLKWTRLINRTCLGRLLKYMTHCNLTTLAQAGQQHTQYDRMTILVVQVYRLFCSHIGVCNLWTQWSKEFFWKIELIVEWRRMYQCE